MLFRSPLMTLGALALLLAGCDAGGSGAGRVVVEGRVVNGARGYDPEADGYVSVTLTGGSDRPSAAAPVQPDGRFRIGVESGGVPPGSYRATVTVYPPRGAGPAAQPVITVLDEPWEVGAGAAPFTVDLARLGK